MSLTEEIAGARSAALFELLRQRLVRNIIVASPAAGADWSLAVPPGVVWELLAVHERFVASAVVATRLLRVQVRDSDGNTLVDFPDGLNITASQNVPFTFAAGLGAVVQAGAAAPPLPSPPYLIFGGVTLRALTTAIDVGDAYSEVFVQVREWSATAVRSALGWLEDHYR